MTFEFPPVVKLSQRLLAEIELAVCRFSRAYKYTFGADLRRKAMDVAMLANRAWRDRQRQGKWLGRLIWALDDLALAERLCMSRQNAARRPQQSR